MTSSASSSAHDVVLAMRWQDDGMVLSSRNWGETSKIVQILTRSHGRYAGLVRGAAAARGQIYAPGNRVNAQWSGRLPEHLGHFVCELVDARSARVLHSRLRLAAVSSVCALVEWLLPEREPEPVIHALTEVLLDQLANAEEWKSDYVRWELNLLRETGAGLDLTRCAVTGMDRNLVYVSPKSGRAVSREGAGSWVPRLLNLPGFLLSGTNTTNSRDLSAGLKLTGYFLHRNALAHGRRALPAARARLVEALNIDSPGALTETASA